MVTNLGLDERISFDVPSDFPYSENPEELFGRIQEIVSQILAGIANSTHNLRTITFMQPTNQEKSITCLRLQRRLKRQV